MVSVHPCDLPHHGGPPGPPSLLVHTLPAHPAQTQTGLPVVTADPLDASCCLGLHHWAGWCDMNPRAWRGSQGTEGPSWPGSPVWPRAHPLWSAAWRRTSSRGESSSGLPCASTSGWKLRERSPGECVHLGLWVGNRPVGAVGLGEAQSGCGRGPGPGAWAVPAREGQGGLPGFLRAAGPAAPPLLPAPHSRISFLVGHAWPRVAQACPMASQPRSLLGTLP